MLHEDESGYQREPLLTAKEEEYHSDSSYEDHAPEYIPSLSRENM